VPAKRRFEVIEVLIEVLEEINRRNGLGRVLSGWHGATACMGNTRPALHDCGRFCRADRRGVADSRPPASRVRQL